MRRSKPVAVSDLLSLFLKESGLEKGYRDYQLLKLWDEILGNAISKATVSKRLDGKKLYVYLSSSVVRDELFMMRSEIIKEINNRAGKDVIDEIILR
jgi:predicted nucleic acid-binding Zn ribbon protein